MIQPAETPGLRLLIDACLTPAAGSYLHNIFPGKVDVLHVDAVLPPATTDQAVFDWAAKDRRAVVTANIGDFARLASHTAGHPGLVLIEDQNAKAAQIAAIALMIEAILGWTADQRGLAGHVFTWRKAGGGRLVVRRLP
jgi:predicted nuclease of predicted toxin-antitoxin system